MNFYYYKGDWVIGKTLIDVVSAETITQADKTFQEKHKIDPIKSRDITVTVQELKV